jgi:hypothetical protein
LKRIQDTQAWWFTPVILALGRLRQEDCEYKDSLGYTVRTHAKKEEKKVRNFVNATMYPQHYSKKRKRKKIKRNSRYHSMKTTENEG